jgi:hypothetical protein
MTQRSDSAGRLVAVKVAPFATIIAIVYSAVGLIAFLLFVFGQPKYLSLPLGIVAPFVHLNINLNLARSQSVFYNIFLCFAAVLSYAFTGWLTGAAIALCFNFTAGRMGGIDAKFFSVVGETDGAHKTHSGQESSEGLEQKLEIKAND